MLGDRILIRPARRPRAPPRSMAEPSAAGARFFAGCRPGCPYGSQPAPAGLASAASRAPAAPARLAPCCGGRRARGGDALPYTPFRASSKRSQVMAGGQGAGTLPPPAPAVACLGLAAAPIGDPPFDPPVPAPAGPPPPPPPLPRLSWRFLACRPSRASLGISPRPRLCAPGAAPLRRRRSRPHRRAAPAGAAHARLLPYPASRSQDCIGL